MQNDTPGREAVLRPGAGSRDFVTEIDTWVRKVQENPEDAESAEQLASVAEAWVLADGLGSPTESERVARVRLAEWIAHLEPDGTVVHLGWREPTVAVALAARGATVLSYLDHPGRAMSAAVRHGSERVAFSVLGEVDSRPAGAADVVVVETRGIEPVLALPHARRLVRSDGWLALLGLPVLPEDYLASPAGAPSSAPPLIEAGFFLEDASGRVVPAKPGQSDVMIGLLRAPMRSTERPQIWLPLEAPAEEPAHRDWKEAERFKELVDDWLRRR